MDATEALERARARVDGLMTARPKPGPRVNPTSEKANELLTMSSRAKGKDGRAAREPGPGTERAVTGKLGRTGKPPNGLQGHGGSGGAIRARVEDPITRDR